MPIIHRGHTCQKLSKLQPAPFRRGTNRAAALSTRWTLAGLSQRDNLYQQLQDAPLADCSLTTNWPSSTSCESFRSVNTERHLTETELAACLPAARTAPADAGTVVAIVVRPDRERRELPDAGQLTPESGLVGDRWAGHNTRRLPDGRPNPDTQLTLMNTRFLGPVAGGRERWPLAGDNLLVDFDLSESNLPIGQRLKIGDAVLQISAEPHLGCAKFSKRFGVDALKFVNSPEGRQLRLRGVNAQVLQAGQVRIGDRIEKA